MHVEQRAEFDSFASCGGVDDVVLLHRAGIDADIRELLHKGVDAGFEDLSDERAVRVGFEFDFRAVFHCFAFHVSRRRGAGDQAVEQFRQTDTRFGADAEDGNERAVGDGLVNEVGHLVGGWLFAFKILFHQLLVDFDDRFDELGVDFGGVQQRARVGSTFDQGVHNPFEVRPVTHGDVERHAGVAEGFADVFDEAGKVNVIAIHLGDDNQPPDAGLFGFLENAAGVHLDAAVGVDADGGGIDAPHGPDGLADEVAVAGGVDDVEAGAGVGEVGQAGLDRPLVGFFLGIEIEDAVAVVHAVLAGDRAGFDQQRVAERRLARAAVPAKDNVADIFNFRFSHGEVPFRKFKLEISNLKQTGNPVKKTGNEKNVRLLPMFPTILASSFRFD